MRYAALAHPTNTRRERLSRTERGAPRFALAEARRRISHHGRDRGGGDTARAALRPVAARAAHGLAPVYLRSDRRVHRADAQHAAAGPDLFDLLRAAGA